MWRCTSKADPSKPGISPAFLSEYSRLKSIPPSWPCSGCSKEEWEKQNERHPSVTVKFTILSRPKHIPPVLPSPFSPLVLEWDPGVAGHLKWLPAMLQNNVSVSSHTSPVCCTRSSWSQWKGHGERLQPRAKAILRNDHITWSRSLFLKQRRLNYPASICFLYNTVWIFFHPISSWVLGCPSKVGWLHSIGKKQSHRKEPSFPDRNVFRSGSQ